MNAKKYSRGAELEQRFRQGWNLAESALQPGARELAVIRGLTPRGIAWGNLENLLSDITQVLVDSGRVYTYGEDVVLESGAELEHRRLKSLKVGNQVTSYAGNLLGNLLVCEYGESEKGPQQFPLPASTLGALLHREPTLKALPSIEQYARKPIYNRQFERRGPGWHAEDGILVHGPEIEPENINLNTNSEGGLIGKLPPHLQNLLGGFCFSTEADLANTVAVLVTGILMNHFVQPCHPVVLIDGNQPGIGKTVLARVFGRIFDGVDPHVIHYTPDDEELQKRILSLVRENRQTVIPVDNAKLRAGGSINSVAIEANSTAPELSLRILGKSENLTRPNDLLWILTMNGTKVSPDLMSRSIPIRLNYEGDPRERNFSGEDPIRYSKDHRHEIIAELFGMIERWIAQGKKQSDHTHRFPYWANTVLGILEANGITQALENLNEAATSFDTTQESLAALAEAVIAQRRPEHEQGADASDRHASKAWTASEWLPLFARVGIYKAEIEATESNRARTTLVGKFLSANKDRSVEILHGDVPWMATLRKTTRGGNKVLYYFDFETGLQSALAEENLSAPAGESMQPPNPPQAPEKPEISKPSLGASKKPSKSTRVRQEATPGEKEEAKRDPNASPSPRGNQEIWR